MCVCDFIVLCKLWWGSSATWSKLCKWAGFGCNAKQPLWEDFQTRNTQEVQYAGLQGRYRYVGLSTSVCLAGSLSSFGFGFWTHLLVKAFVYTLTGHIICIAVFHSIWPLSRVPPHAGPVCRKNTMSSRFCDKLKLLGRCSLRSVQKQCCATCGSQPG